MLDIEWPRATWTGLNACYNLTPAQLSAWIRDFVNEVAKRTGRLAMIYTNTNWWNPCTNNDATFGSNPLFIAGTPQPATAAGRMDEVHRQPATAAGRMDEVDLVAVLRFGNASG